MRDKALAVDCPAREPDPVLLEQLTALAAASTASVVKPWWHRFTVKTGAAAVAGVLLISGATADAEHGKPAPIAATVVGSPTPNPLAPHRKPVLAVPPTSFAVLPSMVVPMHHAGKRAHHPRHALKKKHRDGNRNSGGSGNVQGGVQFARGIVTQAVAEPMQISQGHSHSHAHFRQPTKSQH